MIQDRTVNMLYALVTGKCIDRSYKAVSKMDIWDCKPWIDFIAIHFAEDCHVRERFWVDGGATFYQPGVFYNELGFKG